MCVICESVLMIAEFYQVLLTLYYISNLSCQRQLTTKWKLGFTINYYKNIKIIKYKTIMHNILYLHKRMV